MKNLILLALFICQPAFSEAYLRISSAADDGFIRQQIVHQFSTMDECRKSIAAGKMYGATAGDAQIVVVLVCTEKKAFLVQYNDGSTGGTAP